MADVSRVTVAVFTDPWCPYSWAAEPQWRRLLVEFGAELDVTYVMGGMNHVLRDVPAFAGKWLDASARGGQPVDPRGLLDAPPAAPSRPDATGGAGLSPAPSEAASPATTS